MAGPRSLYDVLNVAPEAEPVVIDAAYKALIKKYHPDQAADERPDRGETCARHGVAFLPRIAIEDHRKMPRGRVIETSQFGRSTVSVILRSPATLHST